MITTKILNALTDLFEFIIIGIIVTTLVFLFLGQPVKVTGDSMLPNFADGEHIIAEKISIKYARIERGEVVILKHPQHNFLLIKRIIGLPGEKFKISQGNIYINGKMLEEDYIENGKTPAYGQLKENVEVTIPQNYYIALGDNRKNSSDSREWGAINESHIVGKSFLVYFPFTNIRLINLGN
jgi:signal peptidase I